MPTVSRNMIFQNLKKYQLLDFYDSFHAWTALPISLILIGLPIYEGRF